MNLEFTPQPEKKKVVRKKTAQELMPDPVPLPDASSETARVPRKRSKIKAGTVEWKTAVDKRKEKQDARTKPAPIIEKPKRKNRILGEANPDSTTPVEFKEDLDHTIDTPENLPVEHFAEMPVDLDEMTLKDIITKEDASYQDITQELHHLEEQGKIELVSQESPWDHFEDLGSATESNPALSPDLLVPTELLSSHNHDNIDSYEDRERAEAHATKQVHSDYGLPRETGAKINRYYQTSVTEHGSRNLKTYSDSKNERNSRGLRAKIKQKFQDWFMADDEEFDED